MSKNLWYANAHLSIIVVARMCIRSPFVWFVCVATLFGGCETNLHPETRAMKKELEDSLVSYMQIRNDDEFFRKYIAFNVRFTLRHKWELNDTVIAKELEKELSNMALVQAAQRRVDAIQQKTD
jgi:hypothetical protein